jgi:hypothetical protein
VPQLLYFLGKIQLAVTEHEFGWVSGGAMGLLEERRISFTFLESDPDPYIVHSVA